MAYTKSQALAKNATPSTPTPSKKISKQGKRRAPPAKPELPPKKPLKSARQKASQKIYASKHRRGPLPKTIAYDKFSSTEAEEKFENLKKRRLLIDKGFIPLDKVLQARLLDYWTYAEKRDIALRKLLQKNFTKPSSAFPAFPPQLLEPWPIPTAGDADPTSSDEAEE